MISLLKLFRYFSEQDSKILDEYLGTIEVVSTTGADLYNAVNECLAKFDLDCTNIIGFGSDGANNVSGANNSVWSRLKEASPGIVQLKCVCHSLALAVEHAFDLMPSNIGYLLSEIPGHFSKSSLRRADYQELFVTMNPDLEITSYPTPFQKFSKTRWLVRGKVLYNILVNWDNLTAYFDLSVKNAPAAQRYKMREILNMLKDEKNRLYFTFLTPIVQEFESLNSMFQASNPNIDDLHEQLTVHYKALRRRVYEQVAGRDKLLHVKVN